MDNDSNRRAFQRFPLLFEAEVGCRDRQGVAHQERVMLQDVSGDGARFKSVHPDKYEVGQNLELNICLPGTTGIKACMKGKATVVWVADNDEIGVETAEPLQFEREGA